MLLRHQCRHCLTIPLSKWATGSLHTLPWSTNHDEHTYILHRVTFALFVNYTFSFWDLRVTMRTKRYQTQYYRCEAPWNMAGETDRLVPPNGDLNADNSKVQSGQNAKLASHRLATWKLTNHSLKLLHGVVTAFLLFYLVCEIDSCLLRPPLLPRFSVEYSEEQTSI